MFSRYIFNNPLIWSESAAIYFLTYSSFIGAVIALRHDEHVGVDILVTVLKERGKWVLNILSISLTLLYCAVLGVLAWLMIASPSAQNIQVPNLGVNVWVVQLSIAIGLTLMFVRALEILYRTARRKQTFPEADRDEIEEALSEEGVNDGR